MHCTVVPEQPQGKQDRKLQGSLRTRLNGLMEYRAAAHAAVSAAVSTAGGTAVGATSVAQQQPEVCRSLTAIHALEAKVCNATTAPVCVTMFALQEQRAARLAGQAALLQALHSHHLTTPCTKGAELSLLYWNTRTVHCQLPQCEARAPLSPQPWLAYSPIQPLREVRVLRTKPCMWIPKSLQGGDGVLLACLQQVHQPPVAGPTRLNDAHLCSRSSSTEEQFLKKDLSSHSRAAGGS